MNVESFCEFLARIGRPTIASPSGRWFRASRGFYVHTPPFATLDHLPQSELEALFRKHSAIGFKYSTTLPGRGLQAGLYIVQDKNYSLESQKRRARACVRKGMECVTVRQIGFDELREKGLAANRDTLERQRRRDPWFTDPKLWGEFCAAGQAVPGAEAWAAFVTDNLGAYMVVFQIDQYSNILYEMSQTQHLSCYVNHVLQFSVIEEMIARPETTYVSGGPASILGHESLEQFKLHAGYEKWPINFVVELNPALGRVLLSGPGQALLRGARHAFPQQDTLKRVEGILAMAQASAAGDGQRPMVEVDDQAVL
jgi:hypothetical protein